MEGITMENNTILAKNPDNVTRKYLKGIIIEPGMSLNQVAADFYERIDGQREFISIVTEIAEEYDTDVQTCIEDLQALSKQLIEKEVVYVK